MNDIAILSGIPMPKPAVPGRKAKYPFAEMEVGGMFFLPDREDNNFATYAGVWGRRLGRVFRTRLCYMKPKKGGGWEAASGEDEPGANLGVGVWRVE